MGSTLVYFDSSNADGGCIGELECQKLLSSFRSVLRREMSHKFLVVDVHDLSGKC